MQNLLSNNRLQLRPVEKEDLLLMYRLDNDSRGWGASSQAQPLSRGAINTFLNTVQNDIYTEHQLRLTVILLSDKGPQAVGFVDLTDFSARHLRAEIGIALLEEYRRQHIGSQVLELLEAYAKEILNLHQLYAHVSLQNIAALQFFKKSNYQPLAQLKDWLRIGQEFSSIQVFQKFL